MFQLQIIMKSLVLLKHALDKEGLATTIKTATFTIDAVNDAPVITTPSTIQIVDSSGASINGTEIILH